MSSQLLLIVVVATLCCFATAQYCDGFNMTTSIRDGSAHRCPYGYLADPAEGRCLTYRQLVNNFLYAPCNLPSDCGPLATDPRNTGSIMTCGTQKVCTWAATRALGDSCDVNANCFTAYQNLGATDFFGCDKSNNTCVRGTHVYTAQLNDRCEYQNRNEYIHCAAELECSDAAYGSCLAKSQVGQMCKLATAPSCVSTAYCNATTLVCDAKRLRGSECVSSVQCSYQEGFSYCYNGICSALRNIGETCNNNVDCNTATEPTAFCLSGSFSRICSARATTGQYCNDTMLCRDELNCVRTNPLVADSRICMTGATNNQTCGTPPLNNRCATNFTCVRGYCSANNAGDQCQSNIITQPTSISSTCNANLVCMNNDVCVSRVGAGQNCSRTDLLCLPGLYCTNYKVGLGVTLNRTCVLPQTLGQPCDPGVPTSTPATPSIDPLNPLLCNSTLQCSRGVCITKYQLAEGAFCAAHDDCDTGFCDAVLKQCTRRKMCTNSNPAVISGTSFPCTCVCSAGTENLGRCIMDLCGRQRQRLKTCLNTKFNVNFGDSAFPATYAFLDSQSSFFKNCNDEHQQFVNCQGYMSKLSAPNVALGDAINYNLAAINGANTLSTSMMVVVAAVVSLVLML